MSDYLSRAAGRATGTNNAIRPALPSLFDAEKNVPDTSALASGSPTEHSIAQAPSSGDAERSTVPSVSEIHERVTAALALAPEPPAEMWSENDRAASTRSAGSTVPPSQDAVPGQDVAPETKAQTPHKALEADPDLSSAVQQKPYRSIAVRARASSADQSPTISTAPPRSGPAPVEPAENSVETKKPLAPPVRPRAIEQRRRDESPPAERVVAFPRWRTAIVKQVRSKNPAAIDSGSSAEPNIQVTIGRLEVRAVQQVPPSPKPVAKSPRISLEEYLRSKNRRS